MRIAQHLISGGTEPKARRSIAAHIASNAFDFFRVTRKIRLLPLNAADRVWSKLVGMKKGGEHQSQILSAKRSITCPLKRGRSRWAGGAGAVVGAIIGSFIGSCVPLWWATRRRREESLGEIAAMHVEFHLTNVALTGLSSQHFSRGESWRRYIGCQ